jgi:hypothetical protein
MQQSARDSALEQAARCVSIANDIWTPLNVRDEAEDIAACLVTVANRVPEDL